MIILDTNVLSALMRPTPDRAAATWLDGQPSQSVWTTSVTVFEIEFGIAVLPRGRRRTALEAGFTRLVEDALENRILPFDRAAAIAAARLAAERRAGGRPVDIRDTQIAGIAIAHRAVVATRNVRHFHGMGMAVIDPWRA